MCVKLTTKLANYIEGINLSSYSEGDVIELSERDADLLVRGGWAEPVNRERISRAAVRRGAIAAEPAS